MINFISNLPSDLRSGGFSAMNVAAFSALKKSYDVNYVGPVNPPVILWQKALSKLQRLSGSRGDFAFFSQRRLHAIAQEVHTQCLTEATLDFFHGLTPWILTKSQRPYIAWSDCTFRDYIDIFHQGEPFRRQDLERIERAEGAWLRGANRVLFTSDWAAKRALNLYALETDRVQSVGIFGEIDTPVRDAYAGGDEFVFISTNFESKGGRVVMEAFREVRKNHPRATLTIVGDCTHDYRKEPGVHFAGFLQKEVPHEYEYFQKILGRARALVNATRSDIAPVLLIEAGYVGCPVISSKRFAIPELVEDGRTGLLVDDPSQAKPLIDAMNWMLEHDDEYQQMRHNARKKTRKQHSKRRFEERLLTSVCGGH